MKGGERKGKKHCEYMKYSAVLLAKCNVKKAKQWQGKKFMFLLHTSRVSIQVSPSLEL
jgi:hypothetical protein